jgi:pyridoxine 5-phosphate synthase
MTHLSVNVNKLATLRNSREKNLPDVTALSEKILTYGAHGITVHPRPDGRHIRLPDVWAIRDLVENWNARGSKVEFNIEGYPSADFIELIRKTRPHQATLVPDPPSALTSNAGWDLAGQEGFLRDVLAELRSARTRVSLFVEPEKFSKEQSEAMSRLMPDRIELYTEAFSDAFPTDQRDSVTDAYVKVSNEATKLGIGLNAGHDLNQKNLGYLIKRIPAIAEVSIGHALICEALEEGLEKTVRAYLAIVGT